MLYFYFKLSACYYNIFRLRTIFVPNNMISTSTPSQSKASLSFPSFWVNKCVAYQLKNIFLAFLQSFVVYIANTSWRTKIDRGAHNNAHIILREVMIDSFFSQTAVRKHQRGPLRTYPKISLKVLKAHLSRMSSRDSAVEGSPTAAADLERSQHETPAKLKWGLANFEAELAMFEPAAPEARRQSW